MLIHTQKSNEQNDDNDDQDRDGRKHGRGDRDYCGGVGKELGKDMKQKKIKET
jgi:hypothetical protein